VAWTLLLSLVFTLFLDAASLTLINDSNYPLYANIYNAAGDKETSIRMSPGRTYIWVQGQSPFKKQYDTPTTPYTIRWTCIGDQPYNYSTEKKQPKQKYISEYGVWNNVPLSATVNALGSMSGTHTCTIKKAPLKKPPTPIERYKKRKYTNEGYNNWSNDGGQTWTNDAGPGWEDEDEENESVSEGTPGWIQ